MSIRFEGVSKSFGQGENQKHVLRQVSFEVDKGEILFILGKSGVGKSVTLKNIIGLLRPDSGKVWVDQDEVSSLDGGELARVRQKCGMVFQHPALLDSLTVFENVVFGLRTPQYEIRTGRTWGEKDLREKAIRTLALVHLDSSLLDRFPSEISYGMQKRVSLARTLAPGPDYLLFDEPTTGLDPITTTAVNDLIQDLSQKLQVTSVVVSHDMGSALKIAHRVLVLDQGKILALGTVKEIRNSPEPLIRDFLAEALEGEARA